MAHSQLKENQTNSKKIILNYGLVLGVLSLLPSLFKYAMGNYLESDKISGILSIILSIIFVVLGIKKFKSANNEFLSWEQGLKIGIGIALVSLIISIIYLFLFSTFIEPEFKNQVVEKTHQKFINAGLSEEIIQKQLLYVKNYFYLSLYGGIIVMGLVIGFIISAISAAIMKKEDKQTNL